MDISATELKKMQWYSIRAKRDKLIAGQDKAYLRHARELRMGKTVDDEQSPTSLSSQQLESLDQYVQALADIPQTFDNPDDVVWPQMP